MAALAAAEKELHDAAEKPSILRKAEIATIVKIAVSDIPQSTAEDAVARIQKAASAKENIQSRLIDAGASVGVVTLASVPFSETKAEAGASSCEDKVLAKLQTLTDSGTPLTDVPREMLLFCKSRFDGSDAKFDPEIDSQKVLKMMAKRHENYGKMDAELMYF